MNPNFTRQQFLERHTNLPPGHIVGLIGSHRRVAWPPLCPACGAGASTHIDVAKIFGRRSHYGSYAYYRFIIRMRVPFCGPCAERHGELVKPVPSVVGSFFRTPAVLSFVGAVAVAAILSTVFLQGSGNVSPAARLYAVGGIALLVALGIFITAREARYLRVPPLTEITSACDFSDNLGYPFGRRRLYAIRNGACAAAFTRANQSRLWTDEIARRDRWISAIAFVVLVGAAVVAWLVRN